MARNRQNTDIISLIADYLISGVKSRELIEWEEANKDNQSFLLSHEAMVHDVLRDYRRGEEVTNAAWRNIRYLLDDHPKKRTDKLRRMFFGMVSFAVAAIVLLVLWIMPLFEGRPTGEMVELFTSVGDTLNVRLPDGSSVTLNSMSTISYPARFAGSVREVHIDGEAFFDVVHDESRPFIVHAGGGKKIEVLGTKFDVKAYRQSPVFLTTLIEGKVNVNCEDFSCRLSSGERLLYDASTGAISASSVDTDQYTAWMRGEIVFQDARLDEIMSQLAKYYDMEPVFVDEYARGVQFGFNFPRFDSIEPILEYIKRTSDVDFRIEGRRIYLRRGSES
jgi:ferric-dicitrate binding protein FerR (iron transport regulator)